ncbi:MAG: hypothetical protein RH860_09095 [Cytophagales bacterium]
MKELLTKDFLKKVYIDELGELVNSHPYISFLVVAVGIEFLGKCLDESVDWQDSGHSKEHFKKAINEIPSFTKYRSLLNSHKLYSEFRCGMAHASLPDAKITLSSKEEATHLVETGDKINLKIEDLYSDFKLAVEHIISMSFPENSKMNKAILSVPGDDFNSGTDIVTGSTQSLG